MHEIKQDKNCDTQLKYIIIPTVRRGINPFVERSKFFFDINSFAGSSQFCSGADLQLHA